MSLRALDKGTIQDPETQFFHMAESWELLETSWCLEASVSISVAPYFIFIQDSCW